MRFGDQIAGIVPTNDLAATTQASLDQDDGFRAAFDRVAAWIDDYYRNPTRYPVLSQSRPGDLVAALPGEAPVDGEPFDRIFADFERLIIPGITHWNHPRFFAYFAISAARVTVLAEALAAALDVNAMLWRTSPAATELEDVTLAWLRRMLGLPDAFHGIVYDTASIGGFTALAAARESLGLDIRARGLAGRSDVPALRVYITEHTHSHIEKGAIALGVGRENVVKIPVDETFAMRPDALARIAACGCTSTPRTAAPPRSCPSFAGCSTRRTTPTRSSSTRTSGCSSRSICRCSTSATPRCCAARSAWRPTCW
jgi:aromatic-L-amino-acid decarboxylase